MRTKYPPLNINYYVQVKSGFCKDKVGIVIEDDSSNPKPNVYKLDFDEGWVGWHERSNLRIIKRYKKS